MRVPTPRMGELFWLPRGPAAGSLCSHSLPSVNRVVLTLLPTLKGCLLTATHGHQAGTGERRVIPKPQPGVSLEQGGATCPQAASLRALPSCLSHRQKPWHLRVTPLTRTLLAAYCEVQLLPEAGSGVTVESRVWQKQPGSEFRGGHSLTMVSGKNLTCLFFCRGVRMSLVWLLLALIEDSAQPSIIT